MDWLTQEPWILWLGVALILLIVESLTVDFVFVMLAGGAAAGAIAAACGYRYPIQVITSVIVAFLLLFVARPVLKRKFAPRVRHSRFGTESLIGANARVLELVDHQGGRVKLSGELWSARTAPGQLPCDTGTDVRVIAFDGANAIVEALGSDAAPVDHQSIPHNQGE